MNPKNSNEEKAMVILAITSRFLNSYLFEKITT